MQNATQTTEARIASVRSSIANWRKSSDDWTAMAKHRGIEETERAYRHEQAAIANACANAAESCMTILFD